MDDFDGWKFQPSKKSFHPQWCSLTMGPQYLAQTIVKVGFEPPQYLRQKGPKMILEAWGPPISKAWLHPCYISTCIKLTCYSGLASLVKSPVRSNNMYICLRIQAFSLLQNIFIFRKVLRVTKMFNIVYLLTLKDLSHVNLHNAL